MKKIVGFIGIFLLLGIVNFHKAEAAELYNISIIGDQSINAYDININASDNIPVNTKVLDNNKVVISVRGVEHKKIIKTFFENAPDIEHVIVNPAGNDGYEVLIKGKNVANSKVYVDSRYFNNRARNIQPDSITSPNALETQALSSATPQVFKPNSESTILTPETSLSEDTRGTFPIEQSQPVSALNQEIPDNIAMDNEFKPAIQPALKDIAETQNSQTMLPSGNAAFAVDNNKKISQAQPEVNPALQSETATTLNRTDILLKIIIAVLLLIIVGKFVIDMVQRTLKTKKQVKIDLTPAQQNVHLNTYKNYGSKQAILPIKKTLKQGKTPVVPKERSYYNDYGASFKPAGWGTSTETAVRKPINLKQSTAKPNLTSPIKVGNTVTNTRVMDFLQSMSEIYEKSGRPDLANTVKKSILKAQRGLD